ncbi:MAG: TetR family transcriptional regulator [Legionellales bacterium]|nr:TetR family transcriptional regulator [Legionellales bacterium]
MARKTKEQAEATKEAILEAAAMVFVDKGVSRASLEEIASQAGVTRGGVYWHFKNKADIFAALHEQLYIPFSEMFLEGLEKNDPYPLQQLEKLCVDLLKELEDNPQKKRLLTIFFLKCDYSGDMACFLEYQKKQKAQSMEAFSRYFERAEEKGYLSGHANPYILPRALVCYVTGIATEYLRNPEIFNLKEQAESLMQIFFKWVCSEK